MKTIINKGQEVKFLKTAYDTVADRVSRLKKEGKNPMYIHAEMVMNDKKFFKRMKEVIKREDLPADEAAVKVAKEFSDAYGAEGGTMMADGAKFDGEEIAKEVKGVKNK